MKIIFVIFFALLIIAVAVLLVQRLLLPMPPSNEKKIFIAITIVGTVLFETLFIASAFIPSMADKLISQGIVSIETNINTISPNYTNEVLDVDKVKSLISDTKQIRYYMNENPNANFIVKAIGLGAYIGFAEDFCDHIEGNFIKFQKSEIPFTLHNIFDFIHQQSAKPVLKAAKIIETVVLIISTVFYIVLLIAYFVNKKGLLTPTNKSVTFGEEV
ncbi:MAG: hypothetical protein LBS50_01900 [Prevotellaceae bacterium]|jgi:hypothetical protein|nr:hypothetical protein [Prevotellaceae bacterium]